MTLKIDFLVIAYTQLNVKRLMSCQQSQDQINLITKIDTLLLSIV